MSRALAFVWTRRVKAAVWASGIGDDPGFTMRGPTVLPAARHPEADKLRHQCSFNLGDRALGRYCETRQWHEPSRQRSLSAPVTDNLRLPAFGPQVPKMREKHDGAMES